MRTRDGGRLRFGPIEKLLREALVRDLGPRTHQGGDDVVFDFAMRVRHAATSDDVEDGSPVVDPSPRENNAAGKHCHSKAEFGAECAVRLRAHGVQSLELSAGVQAGRQRQPDAARRISCLAAGTAETEHGGS
jgi:hypothetical protein